MKIDELIRQRAEELRSAYKHQAPRPIGSTPRRWSRIRRSGIGVMLAAVVAVLLVFGPVALLLRSDPQTGSEPDDPIVTTDGTVASSPSTVSESPSQGAFATLGDRLYEQPGDQGLGTIMGSEENLTVAGWQVILSSGDAGRSWQVVGGAPAGEEAVGAAATDGGVLVAVAAHGGAGSGLYRSDNQGASWDLLDLPAFP